MRLSRSLFRTQRDVPTDVQLVSHQLLIRTGLVRQISAGIYSLTPLALRVLHNIVRIAKEEMSRVGGQEVLLPVVQPANLWEQSGRYEKIDSSLARWKDRNGQDMVLAMTHEEAVTDLVRHFVNSYRQLPLMVYQIQMKFRDEPRPRGGLVRLREFLMKDAYSFHADEESLDVFYDEMIEAYERFYRRCGVNVVRVDADTGMMGGGTSHEFMVLSDGGEDVLIICRHCGYAANREVAVVNGDKCVNCGRVLETVRGIEVGNIFKLGTYYSKPMQATFTDRDGSSRPFIMGCYGIGITRMLACIIEDNHDEHGIVWPESVAPYRYHLISIGTDEDVTLAADVIYSLLGSEQVLYDDRAATAGVKFTDSDLLGLPYRLTVSRKSLAAGGVELKNRRTGETALIPLADIEEHLSP
jgi:prolyl-tRNA synthetase